MRGGVSAEASGVRRCTRRLRGAYADSHDGLRACHRHCCQAWLIRVRACEMESTRRMRQCARARSVGASLAWQIARAWLGRVAAVCMSCALSRYPAATLAAARVSGEGASRSDASCGGLRQWTMGSCSLAPGQETREWEKSRREKTERARHWAGKESGGPTLGAESHLTCGAMCGGGARPPPKRPCGRPCAGNAMGGYSDAASHRTDRAAPGDARAAAARARGRRRRRRHTSVPRGRRRHPLRSRGRHTTVRAARGRRACGAVVARGGHPGWLGHRACSKRRHAQTHTLAAPSQAGRDA